MQANSAASPAGTSNARRVLFAKPTGKGVGDLRTAWSPALGAQIAARSPFLPPSERVLLEQVFIHGWSVARVATLAGEPTRRMSRRVKRLAERTLADPFEQVTMHSAGWSAEMRAVGQAVFVRGMSVRGAAAMLDVPYSVAMLHARTIRALAKAKTDKQKRGAA